MTERYPLHWPQGWPRTPDHERQWGAFKVTPDKAQQELIFEIERLGGRYPLVSSDVAVRRDGMPYADQARRKIHDPGVAVYFEKDGKQHVFACDQYDAPWKNIRAIGKTIEAIRAIERYGASDMMERALSAFEALPAPDGWRTVLGFPNGPCPSLREVRARYRDLVKTHHPDQGGDPDQFRKINEAYEQARHEVVG